MLPFAFVAYTETDDALYIAHVFISVSGFSKNITLNVAQSFQSKPRAQCQLGAEIGCEIKIRNQNTVSNYSCYFQKVFYFCHHHTVQRPVLITNSDREKCPPCALWVSCYLVRRRALVNTCPLLLINVTRGQKWPYAFHLILLRVEFLYMKTLWAGVGSVSSYRAGSALYSMLVVRY